MGFLLSLWMVLAISPAVETPETVMITLHAKAGAEQALADVLARHYDVARRLDLIVPAAAHVTLRSIEPASGDFVEILTWRSGEVPDHAPAAIIELWQQMNALVEPRGSQPGLVITPMLSLTTR